MMRGDAHNGEFKTRLLPEGKRSTDDIGQTALKLYKAGMTDSQIQEIVESLFHHRYSDSTITKRTQKNDSPDEGGQVICLWVSQ